MKSKFINLLMVSAFCIGSQSQATDIKDLPDPAKHGILSYLKKKEVVGINSVSKGTQQLASDHIQCPPLSQATVHQHQVLRDATVNNNVPIGTRLPFLNRTYTVTYSRMNIPGTLYNFMLNNNINSAQPLTAAAADNLLGHHYTADHRKECVYLIHNPGNMVNDAVLVLKDELY